MTEEIKQGGPEEIAEFTEFDKAIADMRSRFVGKVYDVSTTAGMKVAKEDRAEVRSARTGLEKQRKATKEPYLRAMQFIDGEAKRMKAALLEIEEPLDSMIKEHEARKAAEKAEREAAERARVMKHQESLAHLQNYPARAVGKTAVEIEKIIAKLDAIDLSTMEEFQTNGEIAKASSRQMLCKALASKEHEEAEAAQLAADAAQELAEREAEDARRKAEMDARQAKLDAEEKKVRLAREKVEAEESARRAKLEAEEKARLEEEAAKEEKRAKAAARARAKRDKEAVEQARREAVLKAKCDSQNTALAEIYVICQRKGDPEDRLATIEIVAEANMEVGADVEQKEDSAV